MDVLKQFIDLFLHIDYELWRARYGRSSVRVEEPVPGDEAKDP